VRVFRETVCGVRAAALKQPHAASCKPRALLQPESRRQTQGCSPASPTSSPESRLFSTLLGHSLGHWPARRRVGSGSESIVFRRPVVRLGGKSVENITLRTQCGHIAQSTQLRICTKGCGEFYASLISFCLSCSSPKGCQRATPASLAAAAWRALHQLDESQLVQSLSPVRKSPRRFRRQTSGRERAAESLSGELWTQFH